MFSKSTPRQELKEQLSKIMLLSFPLKLPDKTLDTLLKHVV